MRILVVEDEPSICVDIRRALETAHYVVDFAGDGETAWFKGDTEDYDAVVLDLGLPRLDGLSVLKRWRANGMAAPVLILTAREGWRDRVEGIDAGADDYLTKPFRVEELLARLRAITRRLVGRTTAVLTAGAVEIDTRSRSVHSGGQPVALTPLEYRLLAYLIHHRGRVIAPSELIEHVYDHAADRETNAVELLVARVRKKIGGSLIATKRGHGYLVPKDPA